MKTVEIRVRPVVRHVVTRYTPSEPLPPVAGAEQRTTATLETLGEFDNEYNAERVADALRAAAPKPMQYAAVERRHFEYLTNVVYFDVKAEADSFVEQARSEGREFNLFAREVADPIKLAHHELGMVGGGFPPGMDKFVVPPEMPRPTLHEASEEDRAAYFERLRGPRD